jgi:hypothetical protein
MITRNIMSDFYEQSVKDCLVGKKEAAAVAITYSFREVIYDSMS